MSKQGGQVTLRFPRGAVNNPTTYVEAPPDALLSGYDCVCLPDGQVKTRDGLAVVSEGSLPANQVYYLTITVLNKTRYTVVQVGPPTQPVIALKRKGYLNPGRVYDPELDCIWTAEYLETFGSLDVYSFSLPSLEKGESGSIDIDLPSDTEVGIFIDAGELYVICLTTGRVFRVEISGDSLLDELPTSGFPVFDFYRHTAWIYIEEHRKIYVYAGTLTQQGQWSLSLPFGGEWVHTDIQLEGYDRFSGWEQAAIHYVGENIVHITGGGRHKEALCPWHYKINIINGVAQKLDDIPERYQFWIGYSTSCEGNMYVSYSLSGEFLGVQYVGGSWQEVRSPVRLPAYWDAIPISTPYGVVLSQLNRNNDEWELWLVIGLCGAAGFGSLWASRTPIVDIADTNLEFERIWEFTSQPNIISTATLSDRLLITEGDADPPLVFLGGLDRENYTDWAAPRVVLVSPDGTSWYDVTPELIDDDPDTYANVGGLTSWGYIAICTDVPKVNSFYFDVHTPNELINNAFMTYQASTEVSEATFVRENYKGKATRWLSVDTKKGYLTENRKLIAGAAVDLGGGLVGIPCSAHGYVEGDTVAIRNTTNYDGEYELPSQTLGGSDMFVIEKTYVEETFESQDYATRLVAPPVAGCVIYAGSDFSGIVKTDDYLVTVYNDIEDNAAIIAIYAITPQECTMPISAEETEFLSPPPGDPMFPGSGWHNITSVGRVIRSKFYNDTGGFLVNPTISFTANNIKVLGCKIYIANNGNIQDYTGHTMHDVTFNGEKHIVVKDLTTIKSDMLDYSVPPNGYFVVAIEAVYHV